MNKLSVVIITFNEELNIERCIKSVLDIANEIVVVDSFSTDRTKEICLAHNVNFIENKFEGHIQQKNLAASKASFDWVLSLDADEALTEELRQNISLKLNNPEFDGYYMNRLSSYCGSWIKHCGWYPDKKLRLWNRNKGAWGGENPHDKFILNNGCSSSFLTGDLLHYTYHTVWQHLDQVNKFTEIGAKQSFLKGRRSNLIKIVIKPFWKFLRDYIFKLGFLDGYYGFVVCMISAHATFLKYVKMKELQKNG